MKWNVCIFVHVGCTLYNINNTIQISTVREQSMYSYSYYTLCRVATWLILRVARVAEVTLDARHDHELQTWQVGQLGELRRRRARENAEAAGSAAVTRCGHSRAIYASSVQMMQLLIFREWLNGQVGRWGGRRWRKGSWRIRRRETERKLQETRPQTNCFGT